MRIAIIGAGPAGAAFASFLLKAGHTPVLYNDARKVELIVGESLIPAVVPILQALGVEEEVAAISQRKPGVSFLHQDARDIQFDFRTIGDVLPPYAYNVPRPAFDQLLARNARRLGADLVDFQARVEAGPDGVARLTQATLDAQPSLQGKQPDLIVDASGRRRILARALSLPSDEGPRRDVAYFAHFAGCEMPQPSGQVLITRLASGWNWRIPLGDDCLSVGIVVPRETADNLGGSPKERLLSAVRGEPKLADCVAGARFLTEVHTYSNYQLATRQAHGPNWVLLGDAFGFVDPMLSPGLFLALESANILTEKLLGNGGGSLAERLDAYENQFQHWLGAWRDLIQYFYDGRLFALHEAGAEIASKHTLNPITRILEKHMTRNLAGMTSGAWTRRRYSRWLVHFMANHMAWGVASPETLAIH